MFAIKPTTMRTTPVIPVYEMLLKEKHACKHLCITVSTSFLNGIEFDVCQFRGSGVTSYWRKRKKHYRTHQKCGYFFA
jgi:hypothetical protein